MPSPPSPDRTGTPPDPDGSPRQELMAVGKLVSAQGLRGELRVLPMSDFPERFTRPGRRWLRKRGESGVAREVDLIAGRRLPGRELFVVRLEGVDDRSAAEALVGQELLVSADDRPALDPGEFHLLDLVGLAVHRLQSDGSSGAPIGRVTDLIHAGNDLLEVELEDPAAGGNRRRLVPFVEAIVPVVDLQGGWIGITPPPGLLEL